MKGRLLDSYLRPSAGSEKLQRIRRLGHGAALSKISAKSQDCRSLLLQSFATATSASQRHADMALWSAVIYSIDTHCILLYNSVHKCSKILCSCVANIINVFV